MNMQEILKEVFQKVLIIDDKKEEVENLIKYLEKESIKTVFLEPNNEESDEYFEKFNGYPGNLIFLDLYLDNNSGANINTHIGKIRMVLKSLMQSKNLSYGLILWSNHSEEVKILENKLLNDKDEYTLPLFIFSMNKMDYIQNPERIFESLCEELEKNIAASFYIKWSAIIERAKNKVLNDVFGLIDSYEYQDKNLEFLLFHMAKNHVGISDEDLRDYDRLQIDAFNAFSELLSYSLQVDNIQNCDLFKDLDQLSDSPIEKIKNISNDIYILEKAKRQLNEKKEINEIIKKLKKERKDIEVEFEKILSIFSEINAIMHFDLESHSIGKPGEIYLYKGINEKFISNKKNTDDLSLVIEMSPPCDYANKKGGNPKMVSGFLTKFSPNRLKQLNSMAIYTESYPIYIRDIPEVEKGIYLLAIDFRYINNITFNELQSDDFQYLFRVKDKLFADILQKMSSYTARLGLSIIR